MKYAIISFAVGATLGALGGWYFAKEHYEEIANQDMKERINKTRSEKSPVEKPEKTKPKINTWNGDKGDIKEYVERAQMYNTADTSTVPKRKKKEKMVDAPDEIELIPEDMFGEDMDYDQISLNYYANDILADDDNEIIDNRKDIVGDIDYIDGFDEDDAIYVANHKQKVYYEILRKEDDYPEERPMRIGV